MQTYDSIEEGIRKKDINGLRETVGSICYIDRDFSDGEFDEVVRYIESKGIRIKDDRGLVGELISADKTVYKEDDFTRAVFEMKKNFCDERINDVKKIGKSLYKKTKQSQTPAKPRPSAGAGSTGTDPNFQSHQEPVKQSKTGNLVAAAISAAVMVLFLIHPGKILAGILVTAVAAGMYLVRPGKVLAAGMTATVAIGAILVLLVPGKVLVAVLGLIVLVSIVIMIIYQR